MSDQELAKAVINLYKFAEAFFFSALIAFIFKGESPVIVGCLIGFYLWLKLP